MSDAIPPPLPSPAAPSPPPLPAATVPEAAISYSTRNDAFTPAGEIRLRGSTLCVIEPRRSERRIALADLSELRLDFAPTRVEPNRYRCRLRTRAASGLTFYNRSYEGIGRFRDTSAEYVTFVRALVDAIGRHALDCRLVTGSSAAVYALSVIGFLVAVAAVLGVAAFALMVGLWWLVFVKALLILYYLPNCWRWLRRNREAGFTSEQIPSAVVPD